MPTSTLSKIPRQSQLRPDQLRESFSEDLGDVACNRKMFAVVSEALITNIRRRTVARPIQNETVKLQTIDGPASLPVALENLGVKGDADVRIFIEHDQNRGSSYILGTVSKTADGCKITPYGIGKIQPVASKFVFDNTVNEHAYIASTIEEATAMWHAEVPERLRSADTQIRRENVSLPQEDPSGPFLVEYGDGSKTVTTFAAIVEALANRKGAYKVSDKSGQVIMSKNESIAPVVPLSPKAIMDAKARGASVVHVEHVGENPIVYTGVYIGKIAEGTEFSFNGPDGKAMIGKAIEAGSAFAIVEAQLAEETHIDVLRRARPINITFESQSAETRKPITQPVINHRVKIDEANAEFGGFEGTIAEPSLDENGCPVGKSKKFVPQKECFVRIDSGELAVIPISMLYQS